MIYDLYVWLFGPWAEAMGAATVSGAVFAVIVVAPLFVVLELQRRSRR